MVHFEESLGTLQITKNTSDAFIDVTPFEHLLRVHKRGTNETLNFFKSFWFKMFALS